MNVKPIIIVASLLMLATPTTASTNVEVDLEGACMTHVECAALLSTMNTEAAEDEVLERVQRLIAQVVPSQDIDCSNESGAGRDLWEFHVAGIRDPPLAGAYYVAAWTWETTYRVSDDGGSCEEVSHTCNIAVSDGSSIFGYRVNGSGVSVSGVTGSYKGIAAFHGGGADCDNESASFHSNIALLVPITGNSVSFDELPVGVSLD